MLVADMGKGSAQPACRVPDDEIARRQRTHGVEVRPMRDIRVQFLGTGGPYASGGRLQTCISVESSDGRFLIDCGVTALVGMVRAGIDPDSIDTILLTHLHGDHFGGIPFLIVEAQSHMRDASPQPRRTPLRIAGPPGTEERVRQATEAFGYGAYYARARESGLLQFITLEQGQPTMVGQLAVTAFGVAHTPEAVALRVACAGRTIVYSGDTGWTDALIEASAEADLFICLAWTYEADVSSMLSYRTVMEQRARLTCRRLVLTHIGPDMQRHLAEVSAEVAEDGMILTL